MIVNTLKSQSLPQAAVLFGEVINDVGESLNNAHILNTTTHTGTITNDDGQFGIHVFPEDTIKISSVGYKSKLLIIPYTKENEIHRSITLIMDTIALSEAIIYPYPATLAALKRAYLALEVKEEFPEIDLHLELAGIEPLPQMGAVIRGPISSVYNMFSRHAKIQKKYESLVKSDQLRVKSERIYNIALVKRITGLDSDDKAQKFMEFCNLEPEFILNSNNYELICAINDCFAEYSKKLE